MVGQEATSGQPVVSADVRVYLLCGERCGGGKCRAREIPV